MAHPCSLRIVNSSDLWTNPDEDPDEDPDANSDANSDADKRPRVVIMSASASPSGFIEMIDTLDRPGTATSKGAYAEAGIYTEKGFTNKPMKRLPKAGVYARAGVGHARAEFSLLEAEAKGPNASAGAQASLSHGVSAMARAEVASASAAAGPLKVTAGLGFDTGVSVGPDGVGAQVLGIGVKFGPKTQLSLFGSSVECSVM